MSDALTRWSTYAMVGVYGKLSELRTGWWRRLRGPLATRASRAYVSVVVPGGASRSPRRCSVAVSARGVGGGVARRG